MKFYIDPDSCDRSYMVGMIREDGPGEVYLMTFNTIEAALTFIAGYRYQGGTSQRIMIETEDSF